MSARRPIAYAATLLAAYALVGIGGGWMWHELWQPAAGVVVEHRWYADNEALRQDFSGTALYVLVAAGLGLVLGVVFAVLGGERPGLTLALCVVGAVLAGWSMLQFGQLLGPEDPAQLARTAEDGTTLPSALKVAGATPLFAFPIGTLAATGAIFTLFRGKGPEVRPLTEPPR